MKVENVAASDSKEVSRIALSGIKDLADEPVKLWMSPKRRAYPTAETFSTSCFKIATTSSSVTWLKSLKNCPTA